MWLHAHGAQVWAPPLSTHMYACTRTHSHTHTRTCMHIHTHACTHSHTHTYTQAHTHTHTRAHARTHTTHAHATLLQVWTNPLSTAAQAQAGSPPPYLPLQREWEQHARTAWRISPRLAVELASRFSTVPTLHKEVRARTLPPACIDLLPLPPQMCCRLPGMQMLQSPHAIALLLLSAFAQVQVQAWAHAPACVPMCACHENVCCSVPPHMHIVCRHVCERQRMQMHVCTCER